MNWRKKNIRGRKSTRQLMGINQLIDHGALTDGGELVFYLVRPDNLSVLSAEGVHQRVTALSNLIRSFDHLDLVALDSRESFRHNRDWYRQRMEEEEELPLRELLRLDMAHLDAIQTGTASSREFALVCRLDQGTDPAYLAQLEKRISSHGFHVKLAQEQDVKRILAVYYQQDAVTDHFDAVDGERAVAGLA